MRSRGDSLCGLRQLTRQLKGLPPGPESSIQKLAYSELNLRIQKFAMELLGAYGQMTYQAPLAIDEGKWSYRMLAARHDHRRRHQRNSAQRDRRTRAGLAERLTCVSRISPKWAGISLDGLFFRLIIPTSQLGGDPSLEHI